MAKGIYVGAIGEKIQISTDNIVPTSWTEVTAGTEYVASDGTRLTSNQSASTNYYATSACDNNLSSNWVTNSTPDSWIKLEFPQAIEITKMKISISINAVVSTVVSSCRIQGSNDNSTWTDLYTLLLKLHKG